MKDLEKRLARLEAESNLQGESFQQRSFLTLSKSETIATLGVLFDALFNWNSDTPREQVRRELGERFGMTSFGELRTDDELDWFTELAGRWLKLSPAEQQAVECGDRSLISRVWGESVDDDADDSTVVEIDPHERPWLSG